MTVTTFVDGFVHVFWVYSLAVTTLGDGFVSLWGVQCDS